jgi:hypothetical protein
VFWITVHSVKNREKTRESYQKTIFLVHEHRNGTAIGMKTITPRFTVTWKARRIAFITDGDFIDRREGVLGLHDWN